MMIKATLLIAGAVLVMSTPLALAGAQHAAVSGKQGTTSRPFVRAHAGMNVLYDQRDNDNGIGVVSQDFEEALESQTSQGADDFNVPKKAEWHIKEVDVDGAYANGSGPAKSYNIVFYRDAGGAPGAVADDCSHAPFADNGSGSLAIRCKVSLKGGKQGAKYWISVQANMDFAQGGNWVWNTNDTIRGSASQWRNPGDGFGSGCTAYTKTTSCIDLGEGGDFSFGLMGKAGH